MDDEEEEDEELELIFSDGGMFADNDVGINFKARHIEIGLLGVCNKEMSYIKRFEGW